VSAIAIVSTPFAVLSSLIYTAYNFGVIIFFLIGLTMVNTLAYYLSRTNAKSGQRARELAHLERLGESIIQAPADASTLSAILEEHIPNMFPQERVEIRLFPPTDPAEKLIWPLFDLTIPDRPKQSASLWDQLIHSPDHHIVLKEVIPEGMKAPFGDALVAKIMVGDEGQETPAICRGGVYLLRNKAVGQTLESLSALQTLASQIGSALYRAEVFAETLQLQKARQELEIAGRIQSSFLPTDRPELSGWDIAATLLPARQTSGDFYDFVPLDNGNIGILVADVADKGTGAALYMALSRTLIRTYAMQFPDNPEAALLAANERILSDTKSDQFVTVFYAILKPESGELVYANAGHNPAIIISQTGDPQLLSKTGVPLGMFNGLKWKQNSAQLATGDILVLYTDGATEAQNADNDEFGETRLIESATAHMGQTAEDVQAVILENIQVFVGDESQFDDITLMIAIRH
jgi:serine phosphatase RsbU (regulator of sigma subunit)